jgi:heat shock protein HtpX
MVGAFISLALSRMMAKWMMGVVVIDPERAAGPERQLLHTVYHLAKRAGLSAMPEVGIYESPEVNAFATGPTKSRALVAVSSGLLRRMNAAEIEGVLGHEIAHIMNGDMVTMTILQGIVNAFVMFFARAIAYAIARTKRDDSSSESFSPVLYSVLVFVFEILFMILGAIVIATYSRYREFRADAGGADLAGRDKMIMALKGLKRTIEIEDPHTDQPAFQVMKISSKKSYLHLFCSHPPLDERIARLEH